MLGLQERSTLYCGATPTPESDSLTCESEALLTNFRFPESVPLWVGVKMTLASALWPAPMVSGKEVPEIVNCELLLLADEIVTLPPVAVSVEVCVVELPRFTLPKLNDPGVIES